MNKKSKLVDIINGYSSVVTERGDIYIKHLAVIDYLKLDKYEEECFCRAISSGIKTEEQLIESAIKLGFWSKKKEESFKDLTWQEEKITKACEKISDKTQRKMFFDSFANQKKELEELRSKRDQIIFYSAERHASSKRMEMYYDMSFFRDKNLRKKIKEDDYAREQQKILLELSYFLDHKNLIRCAYEGLFFDLYITQNKSPLDIFGKNINNITMFQSKILSYAGVLFSKIKHASKEIPEVILEDAVRLYNYKEGDKNKGENVIHGVEDLKRKMKEKGKVTTEDFLD